MNSKNMHWSRKLDQLVESKTIEDDELFTSREYGEYTQVQAEDMVTGICGYLRRQGFEISEMEEEHRANMLRVSIQKADSGQTAATNGWNVVINPNSSIVTFFPETELRHYAIQGLRVHECGHIIFTDFPTMRAYGNQLEQGKWWPDAPTRLSSDDGAKLSERMKDKNYCMALSCVAHNLLNAIEDGYIEAEIRQIYGGLATTQLETTNEALVERSLSIKDVLEKQTDEFRAVFSQILLYSKFSIMKLDDYSGELMDYLDECIEIIDEVRFDRSPKHRVAAVNELLCLLFPLYDKMVREMVEKFKQNQQKQSSGNQKNGNQQGGGQQTGSGQAGNGQSGSDQPGNSGSSSSANGQNGSDTSQKSESKNALGGTICVPDAVAQSIQKEMNQIAQQAGASKENSGGFTRSLANPDASGGNKKAQSSVSKGKGAVGGAGSKTGKPNLEPAEADLNRIRQEIKRNDASITIEGEIRDEMQKEADRVDYSVLGAKGRGVTVVRAQGVSAEAPSVYEALARDILPISRNMERLLKTIIRDQEADETISRLPLGSRVEARTLYHKDGKYFSQHNFPRDAPRLAVGFLCDQSGSMSRSALDASIKTGIILEDMCRRMELPLYVGGFTTSDSCGRSCTYISYVEPQSVDKKDKYRLVGMDSGGGTPTGEAMVYLADRLNKETSQNKLLLVSTDGQSHNGADTIRAVIKQCQRKGIIVIGAGIGACRESVRREFGENFLDISDLDTMPRTLARIVKRSLLI